MKNQVIQKTIIKQCVDCKEDFRQLQTSTILSKYCPRCTALRNFQRKQVSANKIAENKKVLKNAGFYAKKDKKEYKRPEGGKANSLNPAFGKSKAMQMADKYFSRYIRLKFSFETSYGTVGKCYTCGTIKSIKELECGHWQRRQFKTTRFHEDNARIQCTKCNYFRSGEPEKFEMKLIREIGQEKVNELKLLSQQLGEDNHKFYTEMGKLYRLKTNDILKNRGIDNPWKRASVC